MNPPTFRPMAAATAVVMALLPLRGQEPTVPAPAILARVRALSSPEAARVLPAFAHFDRSATRVEKAFLSLGDPLPEGEAGFLEAARRLTVARAALLPSAWRETWDRDFRLPASPWTGGRAKPSALRLEMDLGPALALLELLETREQDLDRILARLQRPEVRPVFQALLKHRSQSMYGIPMTWELLAQNLAFANSEDPLPRLYAEVQPTAFLDFPVVRRHLASYQAQVRMLSTHQEALADAVVAGLQDYAPSGLTLTRKVSFLFCGGADGWASGGVAGIDLEYFQGDLERLTTLLIHESYHALQHAAAPREAPEGDPLLDLWSSALASLFAEGTATFVAPPQTLTPEAEAAKVARGTQLLQELEDAVFREKDLPRARQLATEGIQGAGPLYWLGARMSRIIVQTGGPKALADLLPLGRHGFVRAYRQAVAQGPGAGLLPPAVLTRMEGSPERAGAGSPIH